MNLANSTPAWIGIKHCARCTPHDATPRHGARGKRLVRQIFHVAGPHAGAAARCVALDPCLLSVRPLSLLVQQYMSRRDFCGDDGMMTDIDVLPKPRGHQSQLGWAQKRQEVTARHPNLRLGASSAGAQYRLPACDPLELHGDSIRKHPLWKRFIEAGPAIHDLDAALQDASLVDDGSRTVAPPAAASSSPTAYHDLTRRFFGPVYVS